MTATLLVSYSDVASDSSSSALSLEIDQRKTNSLNAGRTQFYAGDPIYILALYSSNVSNLRLFVSDGSIASVNATAGYPVGSAEINENKEYLSFDAPDNLTASLPKPLLSGLAYSWVGANGGALELVNNGTGLRMTTENDNFVGIVDVRFNARFSAYRLNGANLATRRILVKAVGDIPD